MSTSPAEASQAAMMGTADLPWERDETLEKATIAQLSPTQIARMTPEELIPFVRWSGLPLLLPEIEPHVKHWDRKTLERVVYLARRCCQNQERRTYSA